MVAFKLVPIAKVQGQGVVHLNRGEMTGGILVS